MQGDLFLVTVDDGEGAVRGQTQVEVVVTFLVTAVTAIEVYFSGAVGVDVNILDAVRVDAVVGTILAALDHCSELLLDSPVLTGVRTIPILCHNVRPPKEKNLGQALFNYYSINTLILQEFYAIIYKDARNSDFLYIKRRDSMFSYVIVTLATFAGAFVLGKVFSNVRRDREFREALRKKMEEEQKGVINYKSTPYVESKVLPCGTTIDYFGFLNTVKEYKRFANVEEALVELKAQERRVNFLFGEIVPLVRRLKMKRPKYAFAVIQRCFDAYSENRAALIDVIDGLWDSTLEKNKKQYAEMILDIARDNQVIINSLEQFYEAASVYLAKVYEDDTSVHVTDLGSAAELDKLTDIFEDVILKTEEQMQEQLKRKQDEDIMTYVEKYEKEHANSSKANSEPESFEERMKRAGGVQLGGN